MYSPRTPSSHAQGHIHLPDMESIFGKKKNITVFYSLVKSVTYRAVCCHVFSYSSYLVCACATCQRDGDVMRRPHVSNIACAQQEAQCVTW